MKHIDKLSIATLVLTLFCAETYAAGFAKYDGIKGESMAAQNQNHNQWINLDATSVGREMAPRHATEQRVDRMPSRSHMIWDNVRNKSWEDGSSGGAHDRPTEEVSFYFNKIPAAQPLPGPLPTPDKRITAPAKPQPISLLVPAVQKVR